MGIAKRPFGRTPDGTEVYLYTLKNSSGMTAEVTDFGGAIVRLYVPDRDGKMDDVVLGYDNADGYVNSDTHYGSLIGRFANRIEDSVFELDGTVYHLYANDGRNHLHGGRRGYDKAVWGAEPVEGKGVEALRLKYLSRDGEENYPGNLDVCVTYTLTEDDEIRIGYSAVSDKDTPVNLTNHSYFNLAGHMSGNILHHKVMINADSFTPANAESLPTGEIRPVRGTPMDFTELKEIEPGILSGYEQIVLAEGYDHNWVLNRSGRGLSLATEVVEETSGRVMDVYTTMPGVQFYTGNHIAGKEAGKDGAVYQRRAGLCLETQYFPNSLKHRNFPSPVLKAGERYDQTTVFKFSAK